MQVGNQEHVASDVQVSILALANDRSFVAAFVARVHERARRTRCRCRDRQRRGACLLDKKCVDAWCVSRVGQ